MVQLLRVGGLAASYASSANLRVVLCRMSQARFCCAMVVEMHPDPWIDFAGWGWSSEEDYSVQGFPVRWEVGFGLSNNVSGSKTWFVLRCTVKTTSKSRFNFKNGCVFMECDVG